MIINLQFHAPVIGQIDHETAADSINQTRAVEGTALDIETDLRNSLPKPNSIFPDLKPGYVIDKKKELYQKHGLALGASYQGTWQRASETLTENNVAAGGWFLFELKWELINRGKDFQGSFYAGLDWRHAYGSASIPGRFLYENGSLWATDAAFFDWNPYLAIFFWEQWFKKDRFFVRIGQLTAASMFDQFRFGDFRSQFSNSQLTFPAATIPLGPPGLGINFKWWPIENSELYILGTITDVNAPPPPEGRYDWSGIFKTGEVLAGLEVGYSWKRAKDDYDHLHVNFWYADSVSRKNFGSNKGIGLKISGHKQWSRWVGYSSVSYNTARGGGFGFTNSQYAVDLGFGLMNPFDIEGEFIAGYSWGRPLDKPDPGRDIISDRDQYSFQLNWRVLITPDLYVTPGAQFIFNPSFNPSVDFVSIPQLKFRLFF